MTTGKLAFLLGYKLKLNYCYLTLDIAPVLSKEFLDVQATIECRFILKCVCDMIITYSQYNMKTLI